MKTKGIGQALAVTAYCAVVGTFMFNLEKIFGKLPNYLAPVAFLLLFSTSALICSLIVFYQPYTLFFIAKKKKQAIDLVVSTAIWLFIFFLIVLSLAIVLK